MDPADNRKWAVLVATIWIQAFTGTNFDFSAYSSLLKSGLQISQVQLSYLAVASDFGKALGWSSGLALRFFPLPLVLFSAATMGLLGYGLQWLAVTGKISLSYFSVFGLCLMAGCSISWFNTICFVLCIRNFNMNRSLALSLTVSFNGLSAAIYTLFVNAISSSTSLYLLLNAILPVVVSVAAIAPILNQPLSSSSNMNKTRRDSRIFFILYLLALITGFYLLFLTSISLSSAWCLLAGALALLALPRLVSSLLCARDRNLAEFEQVKEPLLGEVSSPGEEHGASRLLKSVDFWLYYLSYLCGATVGLVYSNNLGQIAQSLGMGASVKKLVGVYSSCSFFGRVLSSLPDILRSKVYLARTGWLAVAAAAAPTAYFMMAWGGSATVVVAGTAAVGLSSGFFFAAAVSVTSELFGPGSIGVNHNLLITNIPLGSLLYGLLAALVYDANTGVVASGGGGGIVCMGRRCYSATFFLWGCVSIVGLASSVALFLRTKSAYNRFESKMGLTYEDIQAKNGPRLL